MDNKDQVSMLLYLLAEAGGMLLAVAESEGRVVTQRQAELAADMSARMLDAVGIYLNTAPKEDSNVT